MQQQQQYLEFTNKIPTMVRVYKLFTVSFQLRKKNSRESSTLPTGVRIAIVNCDDGSEFNEVTIIDGSPNNTAEKHVLIVALQDNYMKTVNVKFTAPCPHRKLKVVVSPSDGSTLDAIESPPFSVVEYYLHVKTSMVYPYVFYKDVGGKDNGILLTVHLKKSEDGKSEESDPDVRTRTITFRPSLRYEEGQLVPDQKILQSFTGAHSYMISSSGPTELKFRINEVSSKHRNERFCIAMEHFVADGSNEPLDIAPGSSVGIEIRSKVNHHTMKRRIREFEEQMQEQQEAKRQALEPPFPRFDQSQNTPLLYPNLPPAAHAATSFVPPSTMSSVPVAVKPEDSTASTSINFLKVHNDFEELARNAEKVIRMAKVYGPFDPTFENTLRNLESSLLETNDDLVFLLKFHRNGQPSNASGDRPSSQPNNWNRMGSYGSSSLRGAEYPPGGLELKAYGHENSDVQRQGLSLGSSQRPSSLLSFQVQAQLGSSSNLPITSMRGGPLPSSLSPPYPPGYPNPSPNYVTQSTTAVEPKDATDMSGGRVSLVPPPPSAMSSLLTRYPPPSAPSLVSFSQLHKHADASAISSATEDGGRLGLLAEAAANSNRS